MESRPWPENLTGMRSALTCPTPTESLFTQSRVVGRWASTWSASVPIWQSRRSPSGFSHGGRRRCSGHSQPRSSVRRSFVVGRARRPTSKPGAKDFHCPWTRLTYRWLPGNRTWYLVLNQIHPKPPVGLFRNLPPPPAMSPLLPWKDTVGVLPVGNGRTRGSNQPEGCGSFFCRAHLSASRLTTQ